MYFYEEYFPTRSLFPHIDPYAVALINWNRAANQMNTDARVKVGDYFYYGLGTDDIGLIDDDSSEDLEELINTEKALKKEAESILNTFYGKDGIKNKEKDKDDNTSDSKNEKENEGNDKTKDTKVGTKEGKADSKDTKVNTDEGKGDSKDTKIITDEDKKESENVIAADADDKEDKEVKKSKKKKNSIFDIVIYLKSKFYIGHGTVLYKKAVANYQVAADLYSSIAMWNLGWMYENGVGVDTVSIYIFFIFFIFFNHFFNYNNLYIYNFIYIRKNKISNSKSFINIIYLFIYLFFFIN